MHWTQILTDNLPLWLSGLWQTLWLVALSLLIGLTIAIPCGMLLSSRCAIWWKLPVMAFSYIFRGTPMLVQLYIFYYGIGLVIGRIPGVRELALWPQPPTPRKSCAAPSKPRPKAKLRRQKPSA